MKINLLFDFLFMYLLKFIFNLSLAIFFYIFLNFYYKAIYTYNNYDYSMI